ncbi:unnamed protein product [Oppiella nova]|uniref:Sodium/calcium exchanger membrane region domain-containing protein n=1 Tax=Oppiella nova TaxID=334625 RepID=A0A7R9MHS0_9ACAR|nr:unnamed protein product [Oppiella nova]CAG2177523.1 unnamed protein product [Oppiella nova]
MAAGSSAPELATSLIGVFVAKDDIGVGMVVGSAVFNIAFVISICALFAGHVVVINWWPILRVSFFYLISICVLFIAMFDGKISLIESIVFLAIYVIYILFVAYNKQIYNKFCHKFHGLANISRESSDSVIYKTLSKTKTSDEVDISNASIDIGANVNYNTNSIDQQLHITSDKCRQTDTSLEDSQSKAKLVWNLLIKPLNLIHWITVPDCRDESKRNCFGFTFLMSCVWISIYSYFIVWMMTLIGFNLHIPDTVMGLVFIAFGASLPDAIASLLVVRQGLGDMAVTNAIGSNVFDILVCLGVPWFLKTAIVDPGSSVTVFSRGLEYSTISLLTTVVFFLVITHLNGWKLTPKYGLILMVWYLAFISLASLYELNVFGYLNPPVCFNGY